MQIAGHDHGDLQFRVPYTLIGDDDGKTCKSKRTKLSEHINK